MEMKIKYLSNYQGDKLNKKSEDSGYDLRAAIEKSLVLKPMEIKTIPLGFSLEIIGEFPKGFNWETQIRGRSGLNAKGILATVGTIDSGYRGEYKTTLINLSGKDFVIEPGDRICQLIVSLAAHCDIVELSKDERFSSSEREIKAFGSSGLK